MDSEAPAVARTDTQAAAARPVELSVVVPTYNESENVPLLIEKLSAVLTGISWEVIFVDDDSRDGTAAVVRRLAQSAATKATGGVRVVQRIGRRGLSSACVEGALASSAPYIAVMDGDLQHDEKLLPRMLEALKKDGTEIVVGSRFVPRWRCRRIRGQPHQNQQSRRQARTPDRQAGFERPDEWVLHAAPRGVRTGCAAPFGQGL